LSSCIIGGFSRRAQLHEWVSEWVITDLKSAIFLSIVIMLTFWWQAETLVSVNIARCLPIIISRCSKAEFQHRNLTAKRPTWGTYKRRSLFPLPCQPHFPLIFILFPTIFAFLPYSHCVR
jgi:hypothetical protein